MDNFIACCTSCAGLSCTVIQLKSSPLQGRQTHRRLLDWPPEENHKQHSVSSPAASSHPAEWLSSVTSLNKFRLCLHTELELLGIVIQLIAQTADC